MTRTLQIFVAALLTWSTTAAGMTIDEFLDTVKHNHPLFARERMQPLIEEKRSERFLGSQDWTIESSPLYRHTRPLETSPFDPDRIDYLKLDANASRTFWGNGSRLSVGWQGDMTDQDIAPLSFGGIVIPLAPSRYYRNTLSATWALPLLRNRGGELDRLQYELSRFDIDISSVQARENQEGFVLEVTLKFIDWALLDEQLRIARERLELAESELERTKRKYESRLVDEADVKRAENAAYVARSGVLLVEANWKATRSELATLSGDDAVTQSNPSFDLYARADVGDTETLVTRAENGSRLLQVIDLQRQQLARLEAGYTETARPELALVLGAALLGGDDDFIESFAVDKPDLRVGVTMSYPLGNRTAEADVAQTRLQRRQLDLARREVSVTLESSARAILVRLSELGAVLDENVRRMEAAAQRTAAEQKIYEQGRGDLTFVIQGRDSEAVAKLAYAENSALYHQLLYQYRALADELLPDAESDN